MRIIVWVHTRKGKGNRNDTKAEENEKVKIIDLENGQDNTQENRQDEIEGMVNENNQNKKVIEEENSEEKVSEEESTSDQDVQLKDNVSESEET